MAVQSLDSYWMARAVIKEGEGDAETSAEIFIAGPPTEDSGIDGVLVMGLEAFINLRNLLNYEYDRWQDSLQLGIEDIPQ